MGEQSPILRFSQKDLQSMIESGEIVVSPEKKNIKELHGVDLAISESYAWEKFLGEKIRVPIPPKELIQVYNRAKRAGINTLEPHYFLTIDMATKARLWTEPKRFPGFTVLPDSFYWKKIANGELSPDATILTNTWFLIDTTPKPDVIEDKKQMYQDDPFIKILAELSYRGTIAQSLEVPYGSRFGISLLDLSQIVLPEIAYRLRVKKYKVKLPRVIEYTVIANMFHPEWFQTSSGEKFEDKVVIYGEKGYLEGTDQSTGFQKGSLYIGWDLLHALNINKGFRPMIVFPTTRPPKEGGNAHV